MSNTENLNNENEKKLEEFVKQQEEQPQQTLGKAQT